MTRLGIELSAAAIRLIEVDGRWRLRATSRPERVRSFAVLPPSGSDTDAMLASLKGREAAVLVWGAASEHRQVIVTAGSYEAMRREAVASLSSLGVETKTALADIAPVRGGTGERRPVVVALAPADPILDAIQPLVTAGIRLRSVGTPAMALASMAYLRREFTEPGSIEAYIAVEETATCIALMRDGALAVAHELPWGYIAGGALRPHEDIADRLALGLEQYLDAVGAPRASQVCMCGGLPELRTAAVLLTDRLDVEVEPLDALFGIDEARLPEPSTDFRERVAELRLAWAVAADWPPRLNLLRARRREQSRRALAAAAVVAGVVAGVGGAWRLARSDARSVARPPARSASRGRGTESTPGTGSTPSLLRPGSVPTPSPTPVRPTSPTPAPPPLTAQSTLPRTTQLLMRPPDTALSPLLLASLHAPPPGPSDRPAAGGTESTPSLLRPGSVPTPSPPPARPTPPAPVPAPVGPVARPPVASAREAALPRTPAPRAAPHPRPEPILPLDASLETILFSADRKLAIIDGRIVGVGDLVKDARIVDISETAVTLRDDHGRLRRIALGMGSK